MPADCPTSTVDVVAFFRDADVATRTPPPMATGPVHIPGYRIEREIGRGGMGVVYLAHQENLNRPVALKVILSGPHASPDDVSRFRLEAEAVARLHHPNIVEIYDVGSHDGYSYIAFEYLDGGSLAAWQNRRPVPPETAARIIVELARAVQAAHDGGVLHRDLKPGNVLLQGAAEGQGVLRHTTPWPRHPVPKLVDFGLAKRIDGDSNLTRTGFACGTPQYMAPEQVHGKTGQAGRPADVYGLGAILFELLTGRPPFVGPSPADVMLDVVQKEAPSPRQFHPDVPRDLEVIVLKCLSKEPSRRYATATGLADDLARYLDGRPISARAVGPGERSLRWAKRYPAAAALIVVLAGGLLAAGGVSVKLWQVVQSERHARADADAHRRAADAARDAADRERARAEANLETARIAVHKTMSGFASDKTFLEGQFTDLRKKLLTEARPLYAALRAQGSADAQVIRSEAEAAYWLGLLESNTGNVDASLADFGVSAERYRALIAAEPGQPMHRLKLAEVLIMTAAAHDRIGQAAQGKPVYAEVLALLEPLAEQYPAEEAYTWMLARAYATYSIPLHSLGDTANMGRANREIVRLCDRLFQAHGTRPIYLQAVSNAYQNLAFVEQAARRHDAAECYFLKALTIRTELANDSSSQRIRYRYELGRTQDNYGLHLARMGRIDEAADLFRRAVASLEQPVAANPSNPTYTAELARALVHYGKERMGRGHATDATAAFQRADSLLADARAADARLVLVKDVGRELVRVRAVFAEREGRWPDAAGLWGEAIRSVSRADRFTSRWRAYRAHALARGGKVEDAIAELTAVEQSRRVPPEVWFDLARGWGAVAAVRPDPAAVGNVFRLLKAAGEAGAFDVPGVAASFATDPAFRLFQVSFRP